MHNNIVKKGLVIAFIFVFICASFIPNIYGDKITCELEAHSYVTTEYNGSLSGYVTDPSMNPIEGARVRVYFHGTYEEDYSDSLGYYHVTNIPICYCLKNCTASKEGYTTEWVLLGITENTTYDFVLTSLDPPPIEPNPPYGPSIGVVDHEYTFYTVIPPTPDADPFFVMWDWGDGSSSGWLGPYEPGSTASASHTWSVPGEFEIRVKLLDIYGVNETDWSNPWNIKIVPMTELDIEIKGVGLFKIYAVIRNIGEDDAYNISWNINITGGFILIGRETSGSFLEPLPPGEEQSVCSSFFFGFGPIEVIAKARAINAEEVLDTLSGFLFFFYFQLRIPQF